MRLIAGLIVVSMLASACSNEPTIDDLAESLASQQPGLGDAGAECVVAQLRTHYDQSQLARLVDTESESTEAEQDEFADRQLDALRACDLETQVSPALVDAFASANELSPEVALCAVTSLQERFGFWELADQLAQSESTVRFQRRQLESIFACGDRAEVERQLEPQLVSQGVSAADAPCVAQSLAESMEVADLTVLYSGQTNDRFFELYFNAVESCDALPEDG